VLRVEDTDKDRSTDEAIAEICASMRWLGLDWDEGPDVGGDHGPYQQSERSDQYASALEKLRAAGHVYRCFCTPDELEAEREVARQNKRAPVYSGKCSRISEADTKAMEGEGRQSSFRFRVPEVGVTVIPDAVRGRVEFRNELIGDFIVARGDGSPTFNFANVVDDSSMMITHVVRGEDHLPNTPRQLLMYKALGETPPEFAHLPMIVGADRKPLSKRHGSTSVEEFRSQGYLAEGLLNYLALLGWSLDGSTTVFTVADLIKNFSLDRVGKNPAVFDMEKLEWLNGVHLRELPTETLARELREFCSESVTSSPRFEAAVGVVQEKMRLLSDFERLGSYLLSDLEDFEDSAVEKLRGEEKFHSILDSCSSFIDTIEDFRRDNLHESIRAHAESIEIKPRRVFQVLRISISGKTVTAGLFESLEVLGKAESLARLQFAKKLISQ